MNRHFKSIIVVSALMIGLVFLFASRAESQTQMRSIPGNHVPRSKGLIVGAWGGEHISLQVSEDGATVEYDCAHGTIPRRIILDRRGRFDVSGTHVEEHGGPIRESKQLDGYPVRFIGRISGKRMQLTVRNSVTKRLIGIFTLVYGQEAELVKCR